MTVALPQTYYYVNNNTWWWHLTFESLMSQTNKNESCPIIWWLEGLGGFLHSLLARNHSSTETLLVDWGGMIGDAEQPVSRMCARNLTKKIGFVWKYVISPHSTMRNLTTENANAHTQYVCVCVCMYVNMCVCVCVCVLLVGHTQSDTNVICLIRAVKDYKLILLNTHTHTHTQHAQPYTTN